MILWLCVAKFIGPRNSINHKQYSIWTYPPINVNYVSISAQTTAFEILSLTMLLVIQNNFQKGKTIYINLHKSFFIQRNIN